MAREVYEVELTALAYGGDALGRLPDGRAVFVPFGLPGERVRVELIVEKRGHARGRLLEVLRPSPQRITPICRHFGVCGGCHYQHLPYARQLEIKRQILTEQLKRIGGIERPPVEAMVAAPQPLNYRNTIQFHVSPNGKLGFIEVYSPEVLEISECHLPLPGINEVWPNLAVEPTSGLERIHLRAGANDEVMLVLEGTQPLPPEFVLELPLSAVYLGTEGPYVLAGEEHVFVRVLGRDFRLSAGSFFQVNLAQAEAMVRYLLDQLTLSEKMTLLDVYCGVGLFSAFLAPRVKQCVGIEVSDTACRDFVYNLEEFDNVTLYNGAAEEILPQLDLQAEVLVVDPPRVGIAPRALDAILDLRPEMIAYISCDPATLSRDLKRLLKGGYRLERVTPFDMFPQTYSIESISLLRTG